MFNSVLNRFNTNNYLRETLNEILQIQGTYTYPRDYPGECIGISMAADISPRFPKWILDTTRYTHNPAENYQNGEMLGFTKDLTDHHGTIAVKSIELVGNGEEERWNWFWLDVAKYGNIYIIITAESCNPWSPVPDAVGSDPFREHLKNLRYGYSVKEDIIDRDQVFCKNDISDYKDATAAVSILPGPYPTHKPNEDATYNQCEFGMHHQAIEYVPPKLIVDTATLPPNNRGAQYCVRLMESDHFADDTVLLQAPLWIMSPNKPATIMMAHNITEQNGINYNAFAEIKPSLVKVTLQYTP